MSDAQPDVSSPAGPAEITGDGRILATDSGLPLASVFTGAEARSAIPGPGHYPFTRGITPRMYRDELWHMDLYAGFGGAEDAKGRYEFLLAAGASGVNIALDLPTQLGLDSDDPAARGEVGRVGLAVDTLSDLQAVFADTPLRKAGIVFTVANGVGPWAMAQFAALGDKQGVSRRDYVVHLQNDPLKEFTGRGAFILPMKPHIKLAADAIEYTVREGYSHWKPIGICGSQYRWGGGTAIHEIAYGICEAMPYLDELLGRGLAVDDFAPLLEMHLASDLDLFEEVAKFRAARSVWARLLRDSYGAQDPASMQLKISVYTGGYRLTKQEPLNNSVRITIQTLAAILGGVQHLGTLSIDEALSTPSEEAARLAVRTQQILAYEARVGHVVDPLGGSHLVEHLTAELEERIWDEVRAVQAQGGMLESIRSGYLQSTIDDEAYRAAQDMESGCLVSVGVNRFVSDNEVSKSVEAFRIDPAVEDRQCQRLEQARRSRSAAAVAQTLHDLEEAARSGANVVPPMIECAKAGVSVGEVYQSLREIFGTYEDERILL